jgi:micrococcal nuclease
VQDVEARDRYGRLLAYVYRVDDGLFVNEELVADGWAVPYRYPPNVRFADHFSALGHQAREQGLGLWGACGGANTPATGTATATTAAPPVASGSVGACDPNYAGACVPVTTATLHCKDIGVRRFQVVGDDPHGFDGDHDGIACE